MFKMKRLALFLFIFANLFARGQNIYRPSNTGYFTPSNKPYALATPVPTDGRSYKLDSINGLFRPYNGVSEILSYLPTGSQFRVGQFPIVVNVGGSLQSNGLFVGGQIQVWWFLRGQADTNLVRMDSVASGTCPACLLKANNLSDVQSLFQTLINLNLNNVDNTSDATKWAATATLTNKSISGLTNTLSNIPNSALVNNAIGLSLGTAGTDINVAVTPAQLGSSLFLNVPNSGPGSRGVLTAANYNYFTNKIDSVHFSGDSIYDCVAGTCTFRGLVTGTGGIAVLNTLTASIQTFATGTAGSDFGIVSAGSTHTFNFPNASASNRGLLLAADWTTFNSKQPQLNGTGFVKASGTSISYDNSTYLTGGSGLASLFTNTVVGNTLNFTANTTSAYTFYGNATGSSATPSFTKVPVQAIGNSSANTLLGWDGSGNPANILLTTTGTSGAATLSGGILNIPNYATGVGGGTLVNKGSGFRWAIAGTDTVKTVFGSLIIIDSTTNAGALTFTADTTAGNQKLETQGAAARTYQPLLTGPGYVKMVSGSPTYLTPTQVTADLNLFTTTLQGLVPAPGSVSGKVLSDNGTWVSAGGTGTVTSVAQTVPSSLLTIAGSPITGSGTLALGLANFNPHTYFGNNTGSTTTPIQVTSTQLTADLNIFTNTLQGLVPGSGGGSLNFLRSDGTWATPLGSALTFQQTLTNGNQLSKLDTISMNPSFINAYSLYFKGAPTLHDSTQHIEWPIPSIRTANGLNIFANSYGNANCATVVDSGWVYQYARYQNLFGTLANWSQSGRGVYSSDSMALLKENPSSGAATLTYAAAIDILLNDGRRSGNNRQTLNKEIVCLTSIFANHFASLWSDAGTGGGVIRTGAWSVNYPGKTFGMKSNTGAYTHTVGDTIQYTCSSCWGISVGLQGSDGVTNQNSAFISLLDGKQVDSTTEDFQTDGISENGYDNKRVPMARIYMAKTLGTHVLKVVNKGPTGTTNLIVDYFMEMRHPSDSLNRPIVIFHVPYLPAAGYVQVPNLGTVAFTDSMNKVMDSLIYALPRFPIFIAPTNQFTDTVVDMCASDHIHKNDTGYRHMAQAAEYVLNNNITNTGNPGILQYWDHQMWFDNGILKSPLFTQQNWLDSIKNINLQRVTNIGNQTTNALIVTGGTNATTSGHYLSFAYSGGGVSNINANNVGSATDILDLNGIMLIQQGASIPFIMKGNTQIQSAGSVNVAYFSNAENPTFAPFSAGINISNIPYASFYYSIAPLNQKITDFFADSTGLHFRNILDAGGSPVNLVDFLRSGTHPTKVSFAADTLATPGITLKLLDTTNFKLDVVDASGNHWKTNWPTFGSGAVSSVSNSDGTLTISPTTGAVVASLALGHANTWTALQTFGTLTTTGVTKFTGLTSGSSTDSILTWNASTGQVNRIAQVTDTLNAWNGLTLTGSPTNDTLGFGGTLNQNTTLAFGSNNLTFSGTGTFSVSTPIKFPSLPSGSGTDSLVTVNGSSGQVNIRAVDVVVGSWSVSGTTNVTSVNIGSIIGFRIGNVIHMTIGGNVTATIAASNTVLTINIPSQYTAAATSGQCGLAFINASSGFASGLADVSGPTTSTIAVTFISTASTSVAWTASFDYPIN